ncbi:ABC transporter permease [Rhizobium sp. L1K21]|uniref:ABC transporter permease n=1 Tax=Rhizobium sp. L1K21 TaxID=2954933 RepID=UPI0020920F08|nr:ABC transporter permease [Rhizobium sp. L1K21]MCO6184745.1 ABC transporter permease [Rhizobium sp. L1K21]
MKQSRLALSFRLALREMRGGLRGFYIFLACIALGTAAIAAVNSVSQSVTSSISERGQSVLGGDIRFALNNRPAKDEELAYVDSLGDLAVSSNLRSMSRSVDGSEQSLSEIKAVDPAQYPLYGTLETTPAADLPDLLGEKDGRFGAIAAPALLERLKLNVGDPLRLGNLTFDIRAVIDNEPDALSETIGFAPRLMISGDALNASGLVQTGSLIRYDYKVRFTGAKPSLKAIESEAKAKFPDAGWSIRSSANAAPALSENIERFSQFLTLVGLTALIAGGVGVANAVRAYLDSKRSVIATFKCLGAPASTITEIYLIQIALIALVGIIIGLILGAVAPLIANSYLAAFLPVQTGFRLYPGALGLAALFGVLTALAFAILPLGQARKVPATALFREQSFDKSGWPEFAYLVAAAVLFLAIGALAIAAAEDRMIAAYFLGAIAAIFVVLRLVAVGIAWIARKAPRSSSPTLRLAVDNIHRPGALTTPVILSLGLGLTLLVTLSLVDGNLRQALTASLPQRAPDYFFVDIQSGDIDGFREIIKKDAPGGDLVEVPMLRGRILELNGERPNPDNVPPGGRWVLRGDRGITYDANIPENSTLQAGEWWPAKYDGEPLVSFSEEEARELGLNIGDTVTVNVLGRNITARIANLRTVEWQSLSINFVMVFSPNTFRGAPHAWLATLDVGEQGLAPGANIVRDVTNAYPGITTIEVKDALQTVGQLVGQLAIAIRAAGSIALVTSILVLAGALAAGNRARVHDAVVLKTLGATRRTLMKAFILEYMLLGLSVALFALVAGGLAAYAVTALIMQLPSAFLPTVAVTTSLVALILTVGTGLLGTWRILGQKAAPVLREL